MSEYDYLKNIPESGVGEGSGLGDAIYRDVGTDADELPTNSIVNDLIAESVLGGSGVLNVRFITTSGNITLHPETTKIFFVVIGAGAGGSYCDYYETENFWGLPRTTITSAGGGAGGVSFALREVSGGGSLTASLGEGGYGGVYNAKKGGYGESTSFAGITSEGGGRTVEYTIMGDDYVSHRPEAAGRPYTGHDNGFLWGKDGAAGIATTLSTDNTTGPPGGSPFGIRDLHHDNPNTEKWISPPSDTEAKYGHGGAGGYYEEGHRDGMPGGDGMVILVELS